MQPTIIQVQYETLDLIKNRFLKLKQCTEDIHKYLANTTNNLQDQWIGNAFDKFLAEMHHDVFPALNRLINNFQTASTVTQEIYRVMADAELEAANLFKQSDQLATNDRLRSISTTNFVDDLIKKIKEFLEEIKKQPAEQPPIPQPEMQSRSDWGAREPSFDRNEGRYDSEKNPSGYADYKDLKPGQPLPEILDTVVIHHEGNSQTHDPRRVQDKHMDGNGWADIGYHYIIGADGTIYQGRDINVRGSHVDGQNTGKIGILFLGDFENNWWDNDDDPTQAQIESSKNLIRWLDSEYGIETVLGHKDVEGQDTECPGDNLEPIIPELDEVAQER